MSDPRVISIDIETYGKIEGVDNTSLPDQTCFTPRRSLYADRPPRDLLVLTCAITLPRSDPRLSPSLPSEWCAETLAALEPGDTFVLDLRKPRSWYLLAQWLRYADTLIGMNLQFDLAYLRIASPHLSTLLQPFSHTIIDLSVVNYLHSEVRPERSLKTLGPILGTHVYAEEDLRRFPSTDFNGMMRYNAEDTHNTLLSVSALARRILRDRPSGGPDYSAKLSPECIAHYSDTVWSCLTMTENGVPYSIPRFTSYAVTLFNTCRSCERYLRRHFSLYISKSSYGGRTGSDASKQAFLSHVIDVIDSLSPPSSPSALDHPLLQRTDKKRDIRFNEENRNLLSSLLPPTHPLQRALSVIGTYIHSQKLLSSYCFPYLWQRRSGKKNPLSSVLVPGDLSCPLRSPPPEMTPSASTKKKTSKKKTKKTSSKTKTSSTPVPSATDPQSSSAA